MHTRSHKDTRRRIDGRRPLEVALVAVLAAPGSIGAHHSESMFSPTPVWVEGTVIEFARTNPHSIVVIEAVDTEGRTRRWAVEGPTVSELAGKGIPQDFLAPGDRIEVCAFPLKQSAPRTSAGPPLVHGQVLAPAGGEMRLWGNYGKLTNCVRPGDDSRAWAGFLRTNDPFLSEWCWKSAEIPTRQASKALVDEIDELLGHPCG